MSSFLLHGFLFFSLSISTLHPMEHPEKLSIEWNSELFKQKNLETLEKNTKNSAAQETKCSWLVTEYKKLDLETLEACAEKIIAGNPENYYKALSILVAAQTKGSTRYHALRNELFAKCDEYANKVLDPQFQFECASQCYFKEKSSTNPSDRTFPATMLHLSNALARLKGITPYHPRALWIHEHLGFEECRGIKLQALYSHYYQALALFKHGSFEQSAKKLEPLHHQNFMPATLLLVLINHFYHVPTCLKEDDTADKLKQLMHANYPPAQFLSIASMQALDEPTYKLLKELLNNYTPFKSPEAYLLLAILEIYKPFSANSQQHITFLLYQCLNNIRPSSRWLLEYLLRATLPIVKEALANCFNAIHLSEFNKPTKNSLILSEILHFLLLLQEEGSMWATVYCAPHTTHCSRTYNKEIAILFKHHYLTLATEPWAYLPYINREIYPAIHTALLASFPKYNDSLRMPNYQDIAILYTKELLQPTLIKACVDLMIKDIEKSLSLKKPSPYDFYKMCCLLQHYSLNSTLSSRAKQLVERDFKHHQDGPLLESSTYFKLLLNYYTICGASKTATSALWAKFLDAHAASEFGEAIASSINVIPKGLSTMYLRHAQTKLTLNVDQLSTLTNVLSKYPEFQQFQGEITGYICTSLLAGKWEFEATAKMIFNDNKNIKELWKLYPLQKNITSANENFVIGTLFAALAQQATIKNPSDTENIRSYLAKASRLIIQAFSNRFTNKQKKNNCDVLGLFITLDRFLTNVAESKSIDASKQAKDLKALIQRLKVKYEN